MTFRNLKTIFAATAITVGMALPADEAQAQVPGDGTGGGMAMSQAMMTDGHEEGKVMPWEDGYDKVLKKMSPERQALFADFKKMIADPATTPEDIQNLLGDESFGSFTSQDAKYFHAARKAVMGDQAGIPDDEQVKRIIHKMHTKSIGRMFLLSTGGVLGFIGGVVGLIAYKESMFSADKDSRIGHRTPSP